MLDTKYFWSKSVFSGLVKILCMWYVLMLFSNKTNRIFCVVYVCLCTVMHNLTNICINLFRTEEVFPFNYQSLKNKN